MHLMLDIICTRSLPERKTPNPSSNAISISQNSPKLLQCPCKIPNVTTPKHPLIIHIYWLALSPLFVFIPGNLPLNQFLIDFTQYGHNTCALFTFPHAEHLFNAVTSLIPLPAMNLCLFFMCDVFFFGTARSTDSHMSPSSDGIAAIDAKGIGILTKEGNGCCNLWRSGNATADRSAVLTPRNPSQGVLFFYTAHHGAAPTPSTTQHPPHRCQCTTSISSRITTSPKITTAIPFLS